MARHTFAIHSSDVAAFKNCRRKWAWSSPLRGGLTPVAKYAPFFIGSAVHHCLEHRYRSETPFSTSLTEYVAKELQPFNGDPDKLLSVRDAMDPDIQLVRGLLEHYHEWQKADNSNLSDKAFSFIEAEMSFDVPLWGNSRRAVRLAGTFDGVVEHRDTGKVYLWEIKTTRSIAERLQQLDFDEQTTAYLIAAEKALGVRISGIVYTLIRKKLPKTPDTLKNGSLSKAVKQGEYFNTSLEWYLKALRAHYGSGYRDQIPAYEQVLEELLRNGNNFFQRVVINRSRRELELFEEDLIAVSKAMIDPKTPIYPSPSYHCNYCPFRNPCITLNREGLAAANHNLSVNFVRNPRYTDKDPENDNG